MVCILFLFFNQRRVYVPANLTDSRAVPSTASTTSPKSCCASKGTSIHVLKNVHVHVSVRSNQKYAVVEFIEHSLQKQFRDCDKLTGPGGLSSTPSTAFFACKWSHINSDDQNMNWMARCWRKIYIKQKVLYSLSFLKPPPCLRPSQSHRFTCCPIHGINRISGILPCEQGYKYECLKKYTCACTCTFKSKVCCGMVEFIENS